MSDTTTCDEFTTIDDRLDHSLWYGWSLCFDKVTGSDEDGHIITIENKELWTYSWNVEDDWHGCHCKLTGEGRTFTEALRMAYKQLAAADGHEFAPDFHDQDH